MMADAVAGQGGYLRNSLDGLARGIAWLEPRIRPSNVISAETAAGFLPGAGFVQAREDGQNAANHYRSGNYASMMASLLQGTANAGLEALPMTAALPAIRLAPHAPGGPASTLPDALPPIARNIDGTVNMGAVMRDADRGVYTRLSPGQNRQMTHAIRDQNWTEAEVPIRHLIATQPLANPDFAAAAGRHAADEIPSVVRVGGQMYVNNGHHRLTTAAANGEQTARVRIIDLDPPSIPHPGQGDLPFTGGSF